MKSALIIMNLGTPDSPSKKHVRAFLREFLMDRRVVEVPRLLWWCILYGLILPFRTARVSKAYRSIWQDQGSPLRLITQRQVEKLVAKYQLMGGQDRPEVTYAMSYSGPSLCSELAKLEAQGIEQHIVLPLYPQYSATTTGSIYDQVAAIIRQRRNIPNIHVVKQYFDDPLYIEALAGSVMNHWQKKGRADCLLMSFHGIPQRNVDLGDPYYQQCKQTAELLAERLNLSAEQWKVSFQSRLGRAQWLQPYTSETLLALARSNTRSIDIICPAFAADCLETLEEIAVENRQLFLDAGGERFELIECLNDSDAHIEMMMALAQRFLTEAS